MAPDGKSNKKETKRFFKDFKAELKKVIWPTPKQIVNSTVAVITIVVITAVIVLALDLAFNSFNIYGINGLKSIVKKDDETNEIEGESELVNDENLDGESTEEELEITPENDIAE